MVASLSLSLSLCLWVLKIGPTSSVGFPFSLFLGCEQFGVFGAPNMALGLGFCWPQHMGMPSAILGNPNGG